MVFITTYTTQIQFEKKSTRVESEGKKPKYDEKTRIDSLHLYWFIYLWCTFTRFSNAHISDGATSFHIVFSRNRSSFSCASILVVRHPNKTKGDRRTWIQTRNEATTKTEKYHHDFRWKNFKYFKEDAAAAATSATTMKKISVLIENQYGRLYFCGHRLSYPFRCKIK